MYLLRSLCLAWTLLSTADSLLCHGCASESCFNTTSVECSALGSRCMTITSAIGTEIGSIATVTKTCSSLLTCVTPLNIVTEWAVNKGFSRQAHTQLCCDSDHCNFQSLAVPNLSVNGMKCPSCASLEDSLAGTCNATVSCAGAEDSCFNGTSTFNSIQALQMGCMTRNLCSNPIVHAVLFGTDARISCRSPLSVGVSLVLLPLALTASRILV